MKAAWSIVISVLVAAAVGGWFMFERFQYPHPIEQSNASYRLRASSDGEEALRAQWTIDPARTGPNLPPVGRSLFDFAVARQAGGKGVYDIPYPFDALVRHIEERAGCAAATRSCTQQVLIPLGRSLQRTAASPEFFAYPRVVVVVDREGNAGGSSGMLLKDRLYLGYQEKANLIEVISYNEAAARFEFQLVKNYRAGDSPQVVYANRNVCTACHQNQAPLFSRRQWDETNANPRVAARLASARRSFYGFPARRGIEVPNAIDNAIHRANLLAVHQFLWREGCGTQEPEGTRCRAAALSAALQYRLSGERSFDAGAREYREAVVATFERNASSRWPRGLAVPNSEIPNRDPFVFPEGTSGVAMVHIAARLEPLVPRAPLETWTASGTQIAKRFIAGLSDFLADADAQLLDEKISQIAAKKNQVPRRTYVSQCELRSAEGELRFQCHSPDHATGAALEGRVTMREGRAVSGELDSLTVGSDAPLAFLEIDAGRFRQGPSGNTIAFRASSRGLSARLQDGNAIEAIELHRKSEFVGEATVIVVDDFAPLRTAIAAMAAAGGDPAPLSAARFSRATVMGALAKALALPPERWCCEDVRGFPAAEEEDVDAPANAELKTPVATFEQQCAACHRTPERSPPNFLYGDAERVKSALASCAPRIFVRLSMWDVSPQERDKTPMPPPRASHGGMPSLQEYGPKAEVIDSLKEAAADMLRKEIGRTPTLDGLLAHGYESLRPCLPASS
jgi:mono/diheme cytochrome c family protein